MEKKLVYEYLNKIITRCLEDVDSLLWEKMKRVNLFQPLCFQKVRIGNREVQGPASEIQNHGMSWCLISAPIKLVGGSEVIVVEGIEN